MTQIKFFWNLCSKKGSLPPSAASLFTMVREGDNFCIERGNNFCHLPPPSSFSLDQATLFLPALIGPCSPLFFSPWVFSLGSPCIEVQCWNSAANLARLSSVKGLSQPLQPLCLSAHCRGVLTSPCDKVSQLMMISQGWESKGFPEELFFSSFSFSVCTADYFCLRIVLGTCPCEFCSFHTIFFKCQDHWNCNFIPVYIWGVFTPSHCLKTDENMFLSVPRAVAVENQSKAHCRSPFWPQDIRSCSLHTATHPQSFPKTLSSFSYKSIRQTSLTFHLEQKKVYLLKRCYFFWSVGLVQWARGSWCEHLCDVPNSPAGLAGGRQQSRHSSSLHRQPQRTEML